MQLRSLFLATALLAGSAATALADGETIAAPSLRANVTVSSDIVRIGDLIDNAGTAAQIAIYRAPDLGTTGTLATAQVLSALRAHKVIGVDTRDIGEITVTRLARTFAAKDIEAEVARALEHRNGLGEAANLTLTFDRELSDVRLDPSNTGALALAAARFDARSGRFDLTFQIANEDGAAPARLRFTGTAVETVEAAVLTRNIDRAEILKPSDVIVQRRLKSELGSDAAIRDTVIGMQSRRPMRAGQALKTVDLAKPDLVQRDQTVTLVYQVPGIYLTVRGKALDSGTEGDVVSAMNLQSKRTISGVVIGRNQVAVQITSPSPIAVSDASATIQQPETTASVSSIPANPHAAPRAE